MQSWMDLFFWNWALLQISLREEEMEWCKECLSEWLCRHRRACLHPWPGDQWLLETSPLSCWCYLGWGNWLQQQWCSWILWGELEVVWWHDLGIRVMGTWATKWYPECERPGLSCIQCWLMGWPWVIPEWRCFILFVPIWCIQNKVGFMTKNK